MSDAADRPTVSGAELPQERPPRQAGDRADGGTVWRRLHSLSGLVPVGVFMLVQLGAHAKALQGPDAHRSAMQALGSLPALWLVRIVVLVPLAFHALYGGYLALRAQYNVGRYPFSGNWMFVLQRVSGLMAFAFIGLHGVTVWLPSATGRLPAEAMYGWLGAALSSTAAHVPWWSLAYVLGLAACVFHLACGIWTFCARWGITITRRARTQLGAALALVGTALFGVCLDTVVLFASGAPLIGDPPAPAAAAGSCAPDLETPQVHVGQGASAQPLPPKPVAPRPAAPKVRVPK